MTCDRTFSFAVGVVVVVVIVALSKQLAFFSSVRKITEH